MAFRPFPTSRFQALIMPEVFGSDGVSASERATHDRWVGTSNTSCRFRPFRIRHSLALTSLAEQTFPEKYPRPRDLESEGSCGMVSFEYHVGYASLCLRQCPTNCS
jgi:hypothetical protein